jgi:polyisoprenyl-teichoic acid--peptidoglycan teichoic acid transferase
MARNQSNFVRSRKRTDRLTVILFGAFGIFAIVTAVVAFLVVSNIISSSSMIDLPGAPVDTSGNIKIPEGTPFVQPLQSSNGPVAEPWDGASRVTILIMGLDYRDWEAGETARTDTMMLLTLDPISLTAGMLSIPRDMWVNIPGFEYAKINTAYFLGESYNLPGGGPGLAVQTVEEAIGVPINFYAQLDFYSFIKFIDEIGCLDIKIRREITVDPLGPGNTVTLKPGTQPVCGAVALAYARQRYTDGGDFDRAQRQQEVIMAIRDQIFNLKLLPTLVTKSPILYNELSQGVRTNLNLQQIIQLALLAERIPRENIKQAVIGEDQVVFGTSPDGLSIVKPIPDKIRILRDEIFTSSGPLGPIANPTQAADPAAMMQAEQARVIVQNGTGVDGVATKVSDYLRTQGVNVIQEGNADQMYGQVTLIDYTGKPYTLAYLAKTMNIGTENIFSRYDPNSPADVAVVVGQDWQNNIQLP